AFLPGGNEALTVWASGEIRIWSLKSGAETRTIRGMLACSACLSPDRRLLVMGSQEGPIHVWELSTGKEIQVLGGHEGNVLSVDLPPDGSRIVSCGEDETLRVWDVKTGKQILKRDPVTLQAVTFSSDGKSLLGNSRSGFAGLDLATGQETEFNASHQGTV